MNLDDFLDGTGTMRRPPYAHLMREISALLFHHPPMPDASSLGDGGGHTVLIIPPFLTADVFMWRLTGFLQRCGFRAVGWELGPNWGPTPQLLAGLRARLSALRAASGDRVSVVGVSLGGLLARDLAHDRPEDIRQVITVASPIRFPTTTTIEPLFRILAPSYSNEIDVARLSRTPSVPLLNIYSRDDGIVPWESCHSSEPGSLCADVGGGHLTICRNPETLRLVARRLLDSSIQAIRPAIIPSAASAGTATGPGS